jgi:anthranilate phosphoribosyltransferase
VGATSDLKEGHEIAIASLDQGHAQAKLDALIAFTSKGAA